MDCLSDDDIGGRTNCHTKFIPEMKTPCGMIVPQLGKGYIPARTSYLQPFNVKNIVTVIWGVVLMHVITYPGRPSTRAGHMFGLEVCRPF